MFPFCYSAFHTSADIIKTWMSAVRNMVVHFTNAIYAKKWAEKSRNIFLNSEETRKCLLILQRFRLLALHCLDFGKKDVLVRIASYIL